MAMREKAKRLSSIFSLVDSNAKMVTSDSGNYSPNPSGQYLSPELPVNSPLLSPGAQNLSPHLSPTLSPAAASPARGRSASPFRSSSPLSLKPSKGRSAHSHSRSVSAAAGNTPPYWVEVGGKKFSYDPSALPAQEQIHELWDENGNTFIYLSSRDGLPPPSFRVHASVFDASSSLSHQAHGSSPMQRQPSLDTATSSLSLEVPTSPATLNADDQSQTSASQFSELHGPTSHEAASHGSDAPEVVPEVVPRNFHLYFPIKLSRSPREQSDDLEAAIAIRNLFAFLCRRPLVASPQRPTYFYIFRSIAHLLRTHHFTNQDGSTYGEAAATNFTYYIEELRLADVRNFPYKIVEALIVGEEMRSLELYNEAFVHAVGKFSALQDLPDGTYHLVSGTTRNRLERAAMNLELRLKNVRARLTDFEFPSLFAGVANSTSSTESKTVHFKAWKSSYLALRRHMMLFYKDQFGSWPPKARSKKNDFEESGLNRIVLQLLYRDLSDLYDLLADRTALTTRTMEPHHHDQRDSPPPDEPTPKALRRVFAEYDSSSPPVQPPIPFDTPLLPHFPPQNGVIPLPSTFERGKKLSPDETKRAIDQSYNADSDRPTLFLASFKAFEKKHAAGHSLDELCDQRNGHWIFLYAVLQSLPLLVIDAPGVKWNKGVEYFLCEPPKGGAPWARTNRNHRKSWYGVAGGSGVVSLPSDVVDHGIEGVYRRSHCWTAAERWTASHADEDPEEFPVVATSPLSPLVPPPTLLGDPGSTTPTTPRSRRNSHRNSHRNSTVFLGLEALPLPDDVAPNLPGVRRASLHDPNKNFADILASVEAEHQKGSSKRGKSAARAASGENCRE